MKSRCFFMHPQEMSEVSLQQLAEKLSKRYWNTSCHIPVQWNGRLSRTMGRFIYEAKPKKRKALKIEMSKKAISQLDLDTFTKVLLHELCHYHMFIQHKPFQDYHPIFEAELQRVGAISTNTLKLPRKAYQLFCSQCLQQIGIRVRLNEKKFLSSCCRARIIKKETWL